MYYMFGTRLEVKRTELREAYASTKPRSPETGLTATVSEIPTDPPKHTPDPPFLRNPRYFP